MKRLLIFVILISCSCTSRKSDLSTDYFPAIGDDINYVLSMCGTPYFGSSGPFGGRIYGYTYYPNTKEFTAFSRDDPNRESGGEKVQVVILYYKSNIVKDVIVVDGAVTKNMLIGEARQLFQERLKNTIEAEGQPEAERVSPNIVTFPQG